MSRLSAKLLLMALCVLALNTPRNGVAQDRVEGKGIVLELGKVVEEEASSRLGEPNYGYEGHLGSFVAAKDANALALIVVHQYPDTEKIVAGSLQAYLRGSQAAWEYRWLGVQDGMGWHHLSVEDLLQLRKGLLRRWRQLLHRSRLPG